MILLVETENSDSINVAFTIVCFDIIIRCFAQGSSGDLMIRNVQLKHSGKYVCMVHTAVDSVSAAADLIVRGMCHYNQ